MTDAVCYRCIEDSYLQEIIKDGAEVQTCDVCNSKDNAAISIQRLGELLEPIMRENLSIGRELRVFSNEDDDDGEWIQDGEPMSYFVQEILGQYFDFEDEIVDAVCDAENVWPPDGDEPYWDTSYNYVNTKFHAEDHYAAWQNVLSELQQRRRFYCLSAKNLFSTLFGDVDWLRGWISSEGRERSVVRTLPVGTALFRARIIYPDSLLNDVCRDPFKYVGPPPSELAKAGRMNAEGIVVFYGAMDEKTALAELRPAIGNDLAVITVATTKPLKLLNFHLLEKVVGMELSYFQPNFKAERERYIFLRDLHRLISQPVVPGRESDYLITQTMAEYLAHVHEEPFDGILFSSAQKEGGENIVLFSSTDLLTDSVAEQFSINYIDDSLKIFSTKKLEYTHEECEFSIHDGVAWIHSAYGDDDY